MDRRQYATMALMAGLGILLAGVVYIASRPRGEQHPESSSFDSVRLATELIELRMDGQDSGPRRRALKSAAGKLPDTPLRRALVRFADGDLEAAARESADNPFAKGLRGWILIELGRKPEAADELKAALKEAQVDWELRPLFERILRRAS